MLKNCLLALLLTGLVYAATPSAIAQDNGANDQPSAQQGPPMGRNHFDPQRRTEMLTKRLNLTADQQAKVLDIFKSDQSKMQSLMSDSSLSREDRHAKMMEIHKTSDEQVRSLLDPEQQKKWDEMQARREQHMQEHQNAPTPPPSNPQ
jgi:periplasmic protein CpxP/Spy